MYGQTGARPQDFERVARTVHVGGIGGLGETITENDVADFFGQQGARPALRAGRLPRPQLPHSACGSSRQHALGLSPVAGRLTPQRAQAR